MRIEFRQGDVLHVIRLGTTSNPKIARSDQKILQTYHFSREQFEEAQNKTTMIEFFQRDGAVCLDCPFAVSNGAGLSECYTHKYEQYTGFLSMLRSIGKDKSFDDIPELDKVTHSIVVGLSAGRYVRFGTYGEPSLLPLALIRDMIELSSAWTGYTHQWRTSDRLSKYFMASVHSEDEERIASLMGYRSFVVGSEAPAKFIHCPASKEMGMLTTCAKCGLCSGTLGKGSKSVVILKH